MLLEPLSLRLNIEELRTQMYQAAAVQGIASPEVLKISQLLDKKINEYLGVTNERKK